MEKVTAILLAGGKGTRFDPENLKTLFKINGVTLTELVIKDIQKSNLFNQIVLVYNKEKTAEFKEIIARTGVDGVENGDSRFSSGLNGVEASNNEKNIIVDVAAPFYHVNMIIKMIKSLDKYSGVMTTVFDSRADHVLVNNGEVVKVFDRGDILRVKSYQGINKTQWMKSLKETNKETTSKYTEMLKLLIDHNYKIGNVLSENNPRKITTKEDLIFFKDEEWL